MCPRKIKYDPAVVPRQGFFGSPQFLGAFVVQVLPVNLWDFHHDQLGLDMISPMNRDFWVAISHHEPCFFLNTWNSWKGSARMEMRLFSPQNRLELSIIQSRTDIYWDVHPSIKRGYTIMDSSQCYRSNEPHPQLTPIGVTLPTRFLGDIHDKKRHVFVSQLTIIPSP